MKPIAPVSPPRDPVAICADLVAARSALESMQREEKPDAATQARIHRLCYQLESLQAEYRNALGLGPDALIFV